MMHAGPLTPTEVACPPVGTMGSTFQQVRVSGIGMYLMCVTGSAEAADDAVHPTYTTLAARTYDDPVHRTWTIEIP